MGFKADCTGFFFLAYGAYLYITEPMCSSTFAGIYHPNTANHYHTDAESVHNRIEEAINRAWRTNREQMVAALRCPQTKRPTEWDIIHYIYKRILGGHHTVNKRP